MIKFNKEIFKKALIAGFFSAFTIGILTTLTYKSTFGLFLAGSFGSSMVLLFGFPDSPFAQPKNVFFGHLVTALVGVIFVNLISLPIYISIALAVGIGIFFYDFSKYCSPTSWWKSYNGNYRKCIIRLFIITCYFRLFNNYFFGNSN